MKRYSLRISCWLVAGSAGAFCAAVVPLANAQVWAIEGLPWQFETSADKANKAIVLDVIERKKGGYYDSFHTTNYITNNTTIKRQYNCGVSATSTGSAADTAQQATVSSPSTSNTSGNYLDATGNSSATGPLENYSGRNGGQGGGTPSASTDQNNSGDVSSQAWRSPSNSRSGRIDASRGRSDQVLNVDQNNTGTQTANVTGSTGCDFGQGGVALN